MANEIICENIRWDTWLSLFLSGHRRNVVVCNNVAQATVRRTQALQQQRFSKALRATSSGYPAANAVGCRFGSRNVCDPRPGGPCGFRSTP
jgi:hypothetical protein